MTGTTTPITGAQHLIDAAGIRRQGGGAARSTFIRWRAQHDFPKPINAPHLGEPVWDRREILPWLRANGR